MHLAIVGAGPAGLMAGHAATRLGHEVSWFDAQGSKAIDAIKSGHVNAGVFLLHHPCDLLPLQNLSTYVDYGVYAGPAFGEIELKKLADMYRRKVYGAEWRGEVSIQTYADRPKRQEWNGLAALRLIIDMLAPKVHEVAFTNVHDVMVDLGDYDRVVITAPAPALFKDQQHWPSVEVAVHTGITEDVRESYVWYAPQDNVPWYRASSAFGRFAIEYPVRYGGHIGPQDLDVTIVRKPLAPPPEVKQSMANIERLGHIKFAGRFSRWQKGVENHHVYSEVTRWLQT